MSGRSRTSNDDRSLLDQFEQLADATGVLAVSQDGWTHSRVFLMDGDLIACNSEEDDVRLELMLVAGGHVEHPVLKTVRESLRMGGDLGDLLVREGHISGDTLMEARHRLFRDAFFWAAASEAPQMIWDPRSTIFPDNMQFGVDLPALLQEVGDWIDSNRHTLSLLASGGHFVAHGQRPPELTDAAWSAILTPHTGKGLVEALGASSRKKGVESLTALFARGTMTIARDSEGRETRSSTPELDEAETETVSRDGVVSVDMDERMDVARRLAGLHAEEESPTVEDTVQDTLGSEDLDDYERARRGDFIKSYDVLDKVDLSGVNVLGTNAPDSFSDMPAIELGGEDDDEDDDDDEGHEGHEGEDDDSDSDLDVMLDALDRDFPDPSTTHHQLQPLRELDTAELMEPQEGDFNLFDDESEFPENQPEEMISQPLSGYEGEGGSPSEETFSLPEHVTGPFPREELVEYYGKISVFNSIFQIIYGTFSEHIGPDNARQRFNALLSSNQRQYPELFHQTIVSDDGSVEPALIIDNLANCTDRDHGNLLHQGLYELIFSHLFDAKDMLPGDVESEMMERILVHDRQLHPG